jgi:hypothetical protein
LGGREYTKKRKQKRRSPGKIDALLNEKLEKVEWGEYKLGDLFTFEAIKQARSQSEIPTDNTDNSVPYIVQSMFNNMLSRTVNRQWLIDNNEAPVSGNRIVLGVTLPAVSYQPKEFGASQVITAKAKWLNEKNGIFISNSISKLMYQFSYNQKPGLQIYKDMMIQLPTKNNQIDFQFMESFIAELEAERIAELEAYLLATGLSDYTLSEEEERVLEEFEGVEWGEFKIEKIFEKINTKKLTFKADDLPKETNSKYTLPCLTSSFRNQGLNYFVPRDVATILKNVISIPSNSDVYRAYFQSKEFTILSDAYAIGWNLDNVKLSANQYLFTVQCINKVTDLRKYSYKNKLGGWNVVRSKYIKLPIKDNKPNYALMETFISAIQKLVIKDVVLYTNKKIEATKSVVNK